MLRVCAASLPASVRVLGLLCTPPHVTLPAAWRGGQGGDAGGALQVSLSLCEQGLADLGCLTALVRLERFCLVQPSFDAPDLGPLAVLVSLQRSVLTCSAQPAV